MIKKNQKNMKEYNTDRLVQNLKLWGGGGGKWYGCLRS